MAGQELVIANGTCWNQVSGQILWPESVFGLDICARLEVVWLASEGRECCGLHGKKVHLAKCVSLRNWNFWFSEFPIIADVLQTLQCYAQMYLMWRAMWDKVSISLNVPLVSSSAKHLHTYQYNDLPLALSPPPHWMYCLWFWHIPYTALLTAMLAFFNLIYCP